MQQVALLQKYFPDLSPNQIRQLEMLMPLYADWNTKINLISRKDFENFYEHHVLHSLAIAKFIQFKDGVIVMDVGTGGGFPGIPLAILFPHVNFILIDSIAKKIKVVDDVATQLDLRNVKTINGRAEQVKTNIDYVISRATAPMAELVEWTKLSVKVAEGRRPEEGERMMNGWIVLKGGDLEEELKPFSESVKVKAITDYFGEPFFETKKLVYLPRQYH